MRFSLFLYPLSAITFLVPQAVVYVEQGEA